MLEKIRDLFSYLKTEKGQTVIEYALVIVLIVLVIVLAFRTPGIQSGLSNAASKTGSYLSQ